MKDLGLFAQHLACPQCRKGGLAVRAQLLKCTSCGETFPTLGDLPCLVRDPSRFVAEWKVQAEAFLQKLQNEETELRNLAASAGMLASTRRRLLAMEKANSGLRAAFARILGPVLKTPALAPEVMEALPLRPHSSRALISYFANLFRDWSWGDEENNASSKAVSAVMPDQGLTAVLGAGSSRLAYDLHRQFPEMSIACVDINPLLLLAGFRISQGENLELWEFPVAPKDSASFAVQRVCQAPAPAGRNLTFLFADGIEPPWVDSTLDTIVTPWFVDIIPEDARLFLPRINRMLKPGGVWIFHGSLAFTQPRPDRCYSREEFQEIAAASGFKIEAHHEETVPYLRSPSSCYGRMENVLTFAARKVSEAAAPPRAPDPYSVIPWLKDTSLPVPSLPEIQNISQVSAVLVKVLSWVDGKRSSREISLEMAANLGMDEATALHVLRGFLKNVVSK